MTAIDFSGGYFARRQAELPVTTSRAAIGPELAAVLSKPDDRLLADAGTSRDELLGPDGVWRRERETLASIWML